MNVVRAIQSDAVCEWCVHVWLTFHSCVIMFWVYFPQWAAAARSFNCRAADTDMNELHMCKRCCKDQTLICIVAFPPPDWTVTVPLVLSLTYTRRAESELREPSPPLTVCSGLNGNLYIQTAVCCHAAMQPKTYRYDVRSSQTHSTVLYIFI